MNKKLSLNSGTTQKSIISLLMLNNHFHSLNIFTINTIKKKFHKKKLRKNELINLNYNTFIST